MQSKKPSRGNPNVQGQGASNELTICLSKRSFILLHTEKQHKKIHEKPLMNKMSRPVSVSLHLLNIAPVSNPTFEKGREKKTFRYMHD